MPTLEEVERLKKDWSVDPCWDIEDTPGFEQYRADLLSYRMKVEAEARQAIYDKTDRLATQLRISFELAGYILALEERLGDMANQIERLYELS